MRSKARILAQLELERSKLSAVESSIAVEDDDGILRQLGTIREEILVTINDLNTELENLK